MFSPTLDQLATVQRLREAAESIDSKAVGLDRVSLSAYLDDGEVLEELAAQLREGRYAPLPLERIELPKAGGETRPIGIAAVRDRIVQKWLALALTDYFDPLFSDKSYGYRPGKGPLRAIQRCRDFIARGYRYVYRSDIDNFFETIPHERLLAMLRAEIADDRIVRLIELFLANGSFRSFAYLEHGAGVHQGDALSPLLSNIYLDRMDRWLEEHHVAFVRFADDFVLFFKSKQTRAGAVETLSRWLGEELGLSLEISKSYEATVFKEGFSFLGVQFSGKHLLIDNERLQKKVSKLYEMAKKPRPLPRYVDEVNRFVEGLGRYYLQIVTPDSPQYAHLEHALSDSVARRLARAFAAKEIRFKKEALALLATLHPLTPVSKTLEKDFRKSIVDRAKALAKGESSSEAKRKLAITKREVGERLFAEAVLWIDGFGAFAGLSKGGIVLKRHGKVQKKLPVKECRRIVVEGKSAALSAALIHLCAKKRIPIDFIDGHADAYATLHTPAQSYASRALRQLKLHADAQKRLELARAFLRAKIKNQRNYLKYLDKHHRDAADEIARIETIEDRLDQARSVEELMGMEGSASALYWHALGVIVAERVAFVGRITQGASDPVNSALNYGYAILYGEVQHALIEAGLALHISYLHALDDAKPTLVFDLIEEFRTFVVDRSVFSMINRDEPIEVDREGRLTKASRRLVAQNVVERLGSFTRYRGQSHRLARVIREQAYRLARAVDGEKRYRGFVGRY